MSVHMRAPVRHVATFVSAPKRACVSDALLDRATQALNALGATRLERRTLDPGRAVDVIFDARADEPRGFARDVASRLRTEVVDAPVDVVVQAETGRRKKLLVADMDSTMIGQECIDELADFVGLKAQVSAITERAMRGEIAFEPALRQRVALLRGLGEDVIARAIAEKITLTPGGTALVRTMRAHGGHAALVSGGFTAFTSRIAETIGFEDHRANVLIVEDGRFAGLVREPILGREAKLAALRELRARHGLTPEETLAIGDGANDLDMLSEAGLGVAFHAKPAVAAAADARIDHADLSALLFAQGYSRDEFAEAG
jgi:phosphoserine phosphatase